MKRRLEAEENVNQSVSKLSFIRQQQLQVKEYSDVPQRQQQLQVMQHADVKERHHQLNVQHLKLHHIPVQQLQVRSPLVQQSNDVIRHQLLTPAKILTQGEWITKLLIIKVLIVTAPQVQ